jgi:integrase
MRYARSKSAARSKWLGAARSSAARSFGTQLPRAVPKKRKINPRRVDHHVHLPRQGWELLRQLHTLTGGNEYLFPNRNDHSRATSNWAILAALKRMGYTGRMTGHGFRSLAMGVLKERLGYRHEVVDRQLAHLSGDIYGEAYDRALFLDERKAMMQVYADYLDQVAQGAPLSPARSAKASR